MNNKSSHSNFRNGMCDYHDGENVTHQLGNDDYKDGNNIPDPNEESVDFDGSEALGNDTEEDFYSDDRDEEERINSL